MEFEHHGIEGQRWGQRHGPPYPLERSDYSKLEKKLNKVKKDLDKEQEYKIKARRRELKNMKLTMGRNFITRNLPHKVVGRKYFLTKNNMTDDRVHRFKMYTASPVVYRDKANHYNLRAMYHMDQICKELDRKYKGIDGIPPRIMDQGERYLALVGILEANK